MRMFLLAFLAVAPVAFGVEVHSSQRVLPVQYTTPAEVEQLLANKELLTNVGKSLKIAPLKGGKLQITFSRTYSNRCVAANHIVLPEASLSNDRILVAVGQTYRKMMCPMIAQPTLVNYDITLKGLKAGNTYRLILGTQNKITKRTIKAK